MEKVIIFFSTKINFAKYFFFILLSVAIVSCSNSQDYKVLKKSKFFNKKNVTLKITKYKKYFSVNFKFKFPSNYKFPVNETNDTLSETKFLLGFYHNNKLIRLSQQFQNISAWKYRNDTSKMTFVGNKKDMIKSTYRLKLSIPYYSLYNLPKGKQKITLYIYQDYFYGTKANSEDYYKTIKVKKPEVNAKVEFYVNVPQIYKTIISTDGFAINQSKGMDFSFINKGNADLFWSVAYPKEEKYWKSKVIKNTNVYHRAESCVLYHYKKTENIQLYIFDYDIFSRDDIISMWQIKLKDIINDNYKVIKSKKVKWFKLKAKSYGKAN